MKHIITETTLPHNINCAMKDTDSNPIRDEILEVAAHISQELLHWIHCPVDDQPLCRLPVAPGSPFIFPPVLVWGSHMATCAIQCSQQCWLLWLLLHGTCTPMAEAYPTQRLCFSITLLTHLFYTSFFFQKGKWNIFFRFSFCFVLAWFGFKSSWYYLQKKDLHFGLMQVTMSERILSFKYCTEVIQREEVN